MSDLPMQPSSGEHKLKLVFVLPVNTEIIGIRKGKTIIATCAVTAKGGRSD